MLAMTKTILKHFKRNVTWKKLLKGQVEERGPLGNFMVCMFSLLGKFEVLVAKVSREHTSAWEMILLAFYMLHDLKA